MKGLYLKDYYMIRSQIKGFIASMLLFGVFSAVLKSVYLLFLMGAIFSVTFVFSLVVGNQLPGFGYLSALPVSRKQMTVSLYQMLVGYIFVENLFCLLVGILILVINKQGLEGYIFLAAACTGYCILYMDFAVPVTLKFGGEQGRFILLAVTVVPAVVLVASDVVIKFSVAPTGNLVLVLEAGIFFLSLLLLPLSYGITEKIIEKMEF